MIVERKTRNANTGGGVRAVAASKQIGHRDWDIIALALNHNFQTNIFNMHIVGVRIGTVSLMKKKIL